MNILHPLNALVQQINLTAWQYRTSGTVQGAPGNRRSYCETAILDINYLVQVRIPANVISSSGNVITDSDDDDHSSERSDVILLDYLSCC